MKTWALVCLLAAGAIARVVSLPLPGTRDVPDWKATAFVASQDLLHVYGAGGSPPEERRLAWGSISVTTEYPPISQFEMAVVGRLYRWIDPEFHDGPVLTALIKAPGLVAEVILVLALLTWGRRILGQAAEWAAVAFWINPGTWLAGSVLGYLDAQMAVPATLALLAAADNRPRLAGALAAVAVLTKPQAIFVLPVLGILLLLSHDGRVRIRSAFGALAAALAVAAVALVPFVMAGAWPSYWRAVRRLGEHDLVSGTATNAWWLLTWAAGSLARVSEIGWSAALSRPATMVRISTAMAQGIPNPRTVGVLMTAAALGWALWRSRRGLSLATGALVGAWCVLAYFILSAQVHENHSYLALPLLGLAAAAVPRLRTLYWLLSAAFVLNLYLFYGLGMTMPPMIDRGVTVIDLSLLVAAGYCVLAAVLTVRVWTATSGGYNDAR